MICIANCKNNPCESITNKNFLRKNLSSETNIAAVLLSNTCNLLESHEKINDDEDNNENSYFV